MVKSSKLEEAKSIDFQALDLRKYYEMDDLGYLLVLKGSHLEYEMMSLDRKQSYDSKENELNQNASREKDSTFGTRQLISKKMEGIARKFQELRINSDISEIVDIDSNRDGQPKLHQEDKRRSFLREMDSVSS